MSIPLGAFRLVREASRHLLRRPVVGVAAAARTADGKWVLIRRGDTGEWALPGGTLEWGEMLKPAIERELWEEARVRVVALGGVSGVYSRPDRDPRFHAVTLVVHATVTVPEGPPGNPVEIREVRLFSEEELPSALGMGMTDMLARAKTGQVYWE